MESRNNRRVVMSFVPQPRRTFGLNGVYSVGNKSFYPNAIKNTGDWGAIKDFLKTCKDIRVAICFNCGASAGNLYDKNNKAYKVSRAMNLKEVKELVEAIRKINNE